MKTTAWLALLIAAPLSYSTQAIVLEQNFDAANSLGLQVIGELEFEAGRSTPDDLKFRTLLDELDETCARTAIPRIYLIAWSDMEYPDIQKRQHSPRQVALANARAVTIRKKIETYWRTGNPARFITVNMASRLGAPEIKYALEVSGSAPTNSLELGLFAEYAQQRKTVLWVDCRESKPESGQGWRPPATVVNVGRIDSSEST